MIYMNHLILIDIFCQVYCATGVIQKKYRMLYVFPIACGCTKFFSSYKILMGMDYSCISECSTH